MPAGKVIQDWGEQRSLLMHFGPNSPKTTQNNVSPVCFAAGQKWRYLMQASFKACPSDEFLTCWQDHPGLGRGLPLHFGPGSLVQLLMLVIPCLLFDVCLVDAESNRSQIQLLNCCSVHSSFQSFEQTLPVPQF
jgi:hypothetical protein